MKDCARCGPQPESEFHAHAHHPDGLASVCKGCRAKYKREYRQARQERLAAEGHMYQEALKAEVLAHYGGEFCACCGSAGDLGVDHVGGGGNAHRAELFGSRESPGSGYQFWLWLKREGFPPGYQVMCRPCNSSKHDGDHCRLVHPRSPA